MSLENEVQRIRDNYLFFEKQLSTREDAQRFSFSFEQNIKVIETEPSEKHTDTLRRYDVLIGINKVRQKRLWDTYETNRR